ncbi:MAG: alpha/beta fold hydrolase [Saprospiraceae bacterium]|nr:alpha/beta fold hydrolase [Saprospiraceae bacterium]
MITHRFAPVYFSLLIPVLTFLHISVLPSVLSAQGNCDDTEAPVVFVHGFLASGDTWTTQIQRFASNGHCLERYFAFDWNSLSAAGADELLDLFIDSVRLVTGSDQVHLVGHSAGGGRGYTYLSNPTRAAKVISYAHLASNVESGPAGPAGSVPTLNIWSTADLVVNGAAIPGAENIQFTDFDHYQVATSAATFAALYNFSYGKQPTTTEIEPETMITIGGRCITLGENVPTTGATIEVFASDSQGDPDGDPLATFTITKDGFWGPLDVVPNTSYLFKISSSNPSFRKVIYYYEPFVRANPTVYLRTFPSPFSLAGLLLSAIPNADDQSVISVFTATQAVIHGRDQLNLEGFNLSSPELAQASASMIAVFCYDNGGDGQGNAESISTFAIVPFLQGADIPISPQPDQTWTITFNGSSMPVRNWRSKSDGVVIAVFNEPKMTSGLEPMTKEQATLRIWPNPATDRIHLHWTGEPDNPTHVSVRDMLGRQMPVTQMLFSEKEIILDTSGLSGGTYIVTVQSKTGVVTRTFQIQP